MELFCWIIKIFYLLLMLSKVPTIDTRPLRGGSSTQHSDLIAGNEFLKLFLEREDLHSGEYRGLGGGGGDDIRDLHSEDNSAAEIATTSKTSSRSTSARSLDYKSNRNANAHANDGDDSKQVVKLVTSGSKIVFLEEYDDDDDDAVVDAVARGIDLKKEKQKEKSNHSEQYHQQHLQNNRQQQQHRKSNPKDEVKVVAVSVSSSSKRANSRERSSAEQRSTHVKSFSKDPFSKHDSKDSQRADNGRSQSTQQQQYHPYKSQLRERVTTSTSKPLTVKTTTVATTTTARTITTSSTKPSRTTTASPTTSNDFINRSHKSEFSIEEVEPLTMSQHRNFPSSPSTSPSSYADVGTFYDTDSENSASTNIQNVLAAPLVRAPPSKPVSDAADSSNSGTTTYHSSGAWNVTRINEPPSLSLHSHVTHADNHNMPDEESSSVAAAAVAAEDKLLPFQTVIYHDTKEGHGPQSRSISYSSISQNVDDLHAWQKSGILAEAQRNVSESLNPASRTADHHDGTHDSEPAKFYSMPSKMYSVPAKFYSEPSKVYSEPAKVYGEPEKFYSEPAKVYGQPSKFYSEPSKVYSQPAKVYGEPAKTYWPRPVSTTTSTTTATPMTTTTSNPSSSSRRPAIVSRIAFGEAQTTQFPTHSGHPTLHSHRHSPHQHQQQHHSQHSHHNHHHHHSHSNADSQPPPRRILFNLDKLPYDLLNAPQQSPKHLLEPDLPKHHSPSAATSGLSFGRQRPCLEPTSQSSTSQQQHSSLLDQHSNQNAKGLPNRDLVKCVSKYSHSAASSSARQRHPPFTTERSHIEELYTPTPEQNYEIEESVSVMTNGRAHGVQGIGPIPTTMTTTTTTTTTSRSRIRGEGASGAGLVGAQKQHGNTGAQYNTNANANEDDDGEEATAEDNYDDSDNDNNNNDGDNEGDADAAADDDDSNDGGGNNRNKNKDNNAKDDDDDSKVAYVVEGRNYRKYRVEEKTDDGFIVGEYGVVDHNDGNLRGVRYTADSTINRSVLQKALLAFLKLK